MKLKKLAIFSLLLLSLTVLVGCGEKDKTIGVNALAADPLAFKGEITVKGVVQNVDAENFSLVMIDEEEYKTCGLYPCGSAGMLPLYIPDGSKPQGPTPSDYTYSGKVPKIEDFVTVVGSIKQVQGGLFFEVEKIMQGSNVVISKE